MPFVSLNITSDLSKYDDQLIEFIDTELSQMSGFNTLLCKYRIIFTKEKIINSVQNRKLINSSSIRCEFMTFNDRKPDVLKCMVDSCSYGIKKFIDYNKLSCLYSVTIVFIDRKFTMSE